jgi:hypothetical protein
MSQITGVYARDEETFKKLYSSYAPALLGIISGIVKDSNIAEDVLEETFSNVWTRLYTYDEKLERIFTWLSGIARETALKKVSENAASSVNTLENNTQLLGVFDLIYTGRCSKAEASAHLMTPLNNINQALRETILRLRA